jgi:hypothetical protein
MFYDKSKLKSMKKFKLLLLTLFSVISLSVFSQTQVYTTATSGPNVCDGTATLDSSIITSTNIIWQGMGAVINQGSYMVTNLCPGTYTVTYVTNNTPVTLTFVITAGNFNPCLNFGGYITTVDSTINDGSMTVNIINGTAPYTYQWSNGNMLQTINNLPVGGYCCYVMDANGCNTTLCDSIVTQSTGDTLVINNTGTCNNPLTTFTTTIEDCTINYNTVDSAYMTINSLINSGLDSILCVWYIIDTTGTYQTHMVYYPMIDSTGCYNFQLVLYCYNKSMNYKTMVINQTENLGFAGINELSMNQRKLIKIIDMMGRDSKLEPNKLLIKCYSDGTTEKVYVNN